MQPHRHSYPEQNFGRRGPRLNLELLLLQRSETKSNPSQATVLRVGLSGSGKQGGEEISCASQKPAERSFMCLLVPVMQTRHNTLFHQFSLFSQLHFRVPLLYQSGHTFHNILCKIWTPCTLGNSCTSESVQCCQPCTEVTNCMDTSCDNAEHA